MKIKHYIDEDNLYYSCNTGIENCEKCSSKIFVLNAMIIM